MKRKIAYDLDGTLMPDLPKYKGKTYFKLSTEERKARAKWKPVFFGTAKPLMDPEGSFDIITNRKDKHREITQKWVNLKFGKKCKKLIMNSGPNFFHSDTVAYKAKELNDGEYTIYFENSRRIVKSLRKLCPNCAIILVKNGKIVELDSRFRNRP